MSFLPSTQRIIPGEGNKNAPICIIGEAGGAEENRLQRPFVGPAGTVLETCLHAAGIMRKDCYITNVVKIQPRGNDIAPFFNDRTGAFTAAGLEWVDVLKAELAEVHSNVCIPVGKVALAAITGNHRISKYRGYVLQGSAAFGNRKVIPAYHPAASLRGQYILRYYITADFKKAKSESTFPEVRRPERRIIVPETLDECLTWLDLIYHAKAKAVDIEVVNFEVSAIGFAIASNLAISIPMYQEHWDEAQEACLWRKIDQVLTDPKSVKVFQNGIFDMHFLAVRNGIHVQPPIEDTMVAHHIQYPELLKGLEFLVSMYCGSQQYYKDMVKFDNIKKEA